MGGAYSATIISTRVICEQPGRYIGWPSITRVNSGELIAVFSGDRDAHVCPWGKTQMIRSSDHGRTWSTEVTVNNTPLDDRDAGVIETAQGTLLVSWFTSLAFAEERHLEWQGIDACTAACWRRHAQKLTPEIRERWLGSWVRRSDDGGSTWDPPVQVGITAPHGPIQLGDGRILYVGMMHRDGRKSAIGVQHSLDDGRTWQNLTNIEIPPGEAITDFSEPHAAERADGRLIAMIRYQPSDVSLRKLRVSESRDGGRTWSVARATELLGYPPHLIRLPGDRMMVAFGRRIPPFGERACVSADGGETWNTEDQFTIAPALNDDLGYPCTTQLADGSFVTVYYQVDEQSRLSPRPKTSLMCTHWRLAEV